MHSLLLALALAHGSVDEPEVRASRANVGPAGVVGVVAGAATGFVAGVGAGLATAYVVDRGHLSFGGAPERLTDGEFDGVIVLVYAIPIGTFGGAMLGAFVGSAIDKQSTAPQL